MKKQRSIFSFFSPKNNQSKQNTVRVFFVFLDVFSFFFQIAFVKMQEKNVTPKNLGTKIIQKKRKFEKKDAEEQKENKKTGSSSIALPEIGDRIRVFWKDDKKWYTGRVEATRMSMEEDLGKVVAEHEIKYEDGDVEWLYLSQEKFEILKEKIPAKKKQKRKKVVDSDSEDEFIPSEEEPDEEEYVPDEPIVTPSPKKKKKKTTPSSLSSFASSSSGHKRSRTKAVTSSTSSSRKRSKFSTPSSASTVSSSTSTPGSGVLAMGQHAHDVDSAFAFLRPEKIQDKSCRRPDDPDYDATTLYVPPMFLKKQTPAKQQWWKIKSDNMDAVLFFKVGKFYEIFHMDADVAVRETSATFMKGEEAHAGFPEAAYAKFSQMLVEKGYRVVRVEQTETPEMLKAANKKRKSRGMTNRKCVMREVCSILTPGTQTNNVMDQRGGKTMYNDKNRSKNYDGIHEPDVPRHLMSLFEISDKTTVQSGFCVLDAATASFRIGYLQDGLSNRMSENS